MQIYGIVIFLILFLIIFPDLYLYLRFMRRRVSKSISILHWIISGYFTFVTMSILLNINNILSPITGFRLMLFIASLGTIYLPKLIFSNFDLIFFITRKRWRTIQYAGYLFASMTFISILYAIHFGKFNFGKNEYSVEIDNLPDAFDGYKIVQMSDMHLGSFSLSEERVKPLFDSINTENADLVVFTGDMVNTFADEMKGWDSLFLSLQSKDRHLAILGNHDYSPYFKWRNPKLRDTNWTGIRTGIEKLGFVLLQNEAQIIRRGNDSIAILGVEYSDGEQHKNLPNLCDIERAERPVKDTKTKILLMHDPTIYDDSIAGKKDFVLTLSGHTHSAQIGIDLPNFKLSPAHLKFKYCDGKYKVGYQYIIVSRGLGCAGIPARLGMSPRYEVITLKKKGVRTNDGKTETEKKRP